jgi:hypothetical protein
VILFYVALILAGIVLTVALRHRPGLPRVCAALGAVLGILAIITGFTIGPYVALVAVVLLVIAAARLAPAKSVRDGAGT